MNEIKTFYGYDYEELSDKVTKYMRQIRETTEHQVTAEIIHRGQDIKGVYWDVKITMLKPTKTIQKSIVFRFNGRLCDPDVDTQYNNFFDNEDRKVIDYQFSGKDLFVRYEETIYEEEN